MEPANGDGWAELRDDGSLQGEISLLNDAIREGHVRTVAGESVDKPVDGALIRADRSIAYPIRDGIPVMLVAEGLSIPKINLTGNG